MKEDILKEDDENQMDFASSKFQQPTDQEEQILQQAILAGLIENFSRKSAVFDQNGNEIIQSNKTKILYESQQTEHKLTIHQFSPLSGKNQPENLVYSEIYALDQKSPVDGSIKTMYYMKGATKIDNMSWLNNLGGDLLIQRGLPIHEHDSRALNSLESRKSLLMAKAFATAKSKKQGKNAPSGGLVSFDSGQVKVYS